MQTFAEISQINPFRNLDRFLDASLSTEDGATFKVHRLQLALKNIYFKSIFSGKFSETQDILIRGIDGSTLGLILRFLYTGYVSLNRDNAMDLWIASDYLLVDALKEQCGSFVMKEMDEENCLGIFHTLWKIAGLGSIDECCRYLIVHFKSIVQKCFLGHTDDSKRSNLSIIQELPFEALKKILENRSLNTTDERMVVDVIKAWLELENRKRIKYVPELLKCIYLEDKDSQFQRQILSLNPFNDNHSILSSHFGDSQVGLQHYSRGARAPANLHFIAHYCMSRNRFYLDLYLTYDNKLDIWRKLATNVALCPDFLIQIGYKVYMFDAWENVSMAFNMLDCSRIPMPPINTSRFRYSVVSVEDHIYVMGGVTADFEDTDVIERYDPVQNAWSTVTPMHPMILSDTVAMNGRVYAIGDIGEGPNRSMMVQVYRPGSDSWYVVDSPRHFRHDFTSVVYRGNLYVIGGEGLESPVRTVEEYNPEKDSWRVLPDFPVHYALPKAIELEDLLIVYENQLENRRFMSNTPPTFWDADTETWTITDESSPMYHVNLYQFCTIHQPQIVRGLTKENRIAHHDWVKSFLA